MKQTMKTAALLLAAMGMGYLGGLLSQTNHPAGAVEQPVVKEIVRAKAFELVDAEGQTRGQFFMKNDGNPALFLYDAAGKRRGAFSIMKDGNPDLCLSDAMGKTRGLFFVKSDGNPALCLYDAAEKTRGVFGGVAKECNPVLYLYDTAGKARGLFGMNGEGEGLTFLTFFDPMGNAIRNITSQPDQQVTQPSQQQILQPTLPQITEDYIKSIVYLQQGTQGAPAGKHVFLDDQLYKMWLQSSPNMRQESIQFIQSHHLFIGTDEQEESLQIMAINDCMTGKLTQQIQILASAYPIYNSKVKSIYNSFVDYLRMKIIPIAGE